MPTAYILNKAESLWGKKWRFFILFYLNDGPRRFTEIKANVPGCSGKILSEILREMEKNHLIIRKQYNTIPVKVTYELDPEIKDLAAQFKNYYLDVAKYFYKNHEIHKIPNDIVELLRQDLDTFK